MAPIGVGGTCRYVLQNQKKNVIAENANRKARIICVLEYLG